MIMKASETTVDVKWAHGCPPYKRKVNFVVGMALDRGSSRRRVEEGWLAEAGACCYEGG